MGDPFDKHRPGLESPGREVERSTHAADDFTPANVSRFITCSADGALKIDTEDQAAKIIQCFKGYNPIVVKKIYKADSDTITVDCWL